MEKNSKFIPTRETLLSKLKDWNNDESWREFFHMYRQLIFSTAIKSGLREHEAEEVVQETAISVAKTIKEFKYDPKKCRFKNWLGHLAQKRIADRFRKRSRELPVNDTRSRGTAKTPAIERLPDARAVDLDAIWEEEWQQKLLDTAIERVKSLVSAEQYQLFDFYVVRKMPATKVARDLGSSMTQVYLAKHRISKLLKKEVQRLDADLG